MSGDAWSDGMMAVVEGKRLDDNPYLFNGDATAVSDWADGYGAGLQEQANTALRSRTGAIGDDVILRRVDAQTPQSVAQAIGLPLSQWPGNCYAVAVQMNEKLGLGLIACYGPFSGWVARESRFAQRMAALGVVNHGWLATKAGVIVDPTRWVFENTEPAIHIGIDSEHEYERGGNTALRRLLGERPRPDFNPAKSGLRYLPQGDGADDVAIAWVLAQLQESPQRPARAVTVQELFWLCNSNPVDLASVEGPMARRFYEIAQRLGMRALIPIENWAMVMAADPPALPRADHDSFDTDANTDTDTDADVDADADAQSEGAGPCVAASPRG